MSEQEDEVSLFDDESSDDAWDPKLLPENNGYIKKTWDLVRM